MDVSMNSLSISPGGEYDDQQHALNYLVNTKDTIVCEETQHRVNKHHNHHASDKNHTDIADVVANLAGYEGVAIYNFLHIINLPLLRSAKS